ncbi:MAG TPA: hypothetical protein VIM98_03590 [Dyella sp.]|uniref:hypothetical protein n=1 Tax=Dyella sp. TaxID=1869338 RepID=UPI002F94C178
MRPTTRLVALGLTGTLLLAACAHKDKDAPLAFVPADTPYVVANLDVLDDSTRSALLSQADAELHQQIAQLKVAAEDMKDPDSARLLKAFIAELDGKTIETFAQNNGLDLKGYSAFYGVGLAPVARIQLTDPKAFDAFVGRLETAYGKKLDTASIGNQSYRKHVSTEAGTQVILATVGKQAVAALLPADASEAVLRQVLGLDRPAKSLQDDGRLKQIAKDKGYKPYIVGQLDVARTLALASSGKDPFFAAMLKAHAESEAAKTGEPVANQMQVPASCQADTARIAARVPSMSFGYTTLDAKRQTARFDLALADDIVKAFSGLKVALPGLGTDADAPFDLSIALPVKDLRTFWSAQADAVAAKPFSCPALLDMNDQFAKIGQLADRAAMPPFGDMQGLRIVLDSFAPDPNATLPKFTGRVLLATSNPAGLIALGQVGMPALGQLKLTQDGKPVALPENMTATLGQPAWAAMNDKALALGIGAGEDSKLGDLLKASEGDAGRMMRMHLSGDMYMTWVQAMEAKSEQLAQITATMNKEGDDGDAAKEQQQAAARSKAQFESMRMQAARIKNLGGEAHVDEHGLVVTNNVEVK